MVRARGKTQDGVVGVGESDVPVLAFSAAAFREKLSAWYRKNARELPWRNVRDPYATWLSEIMLQQTRVATVMERYVIFLEHFPTIASLAEADESQVLAQWSGLGYYRRARMLHSGAQFVMREWKGKLPRSAKELRTLPGVGDYTAAAIASIAFREPVAVMDGNVERVLCRVLGQAEDRSGKARARLGRVAQALVPEPAAKSSRLNPAGDHNQAMMELGATVCLPRAPLCLHCPVFDFCETRGEHVTAPRDKPRSRTVAHLLALRKRGVVTEILLEKRPAEASLMAGMLELPPLPLEAVEGLEPVMRVRHAITNTNYYVEVYGSPAMGVEPEPFLNEDSEEEAVAGAGVEGEARVVNEDEEVFVAQIAEELQEETLVSAVPASAEMLSWVATSSLGLQPLTGLARKVLQRIGVMVVPEPRIR